MALVSLERRGQPSPLGLVSAMSTTKQTGGGFIPRLGAAFNAFVATMFSPGYPMSPANETQEEGVRQYEYPQGANIVLKPRQAEGLTPFEWMINIADVYDTLNMAILYKQEEMAALDWEIVPKDEKKPPSQAQLSEAEDRLERPAGIGAPGKHRFAQWITAIIWEMLVTDATSVFINRSRGGDVLSWDLVDGSTIKPLIDGRGRLPMNGAPQYQQILYGRPFWEGTGDELLYTPKNVRARSAYGRSPTEMLVLTINRALRRQTFDISYYTDGNIPDALVPAPAEWSEDQIEKMQDWFDNHVSKTKQRRKMWFLPSKNGRIAPYQFKQPIPDADIEKFLDQRTFAMLGVVQQALGFVDDVNRANGGQMENTELRRRLPTMRFLSGVINDLFFGANLPDCRIQFAGEKPEEDKLRQAQVDDIQLKNGSLSIDDVLARDGRKTTGQRFLYLGTGPIPFPPSDEQLKAALEPPKTPEELANITTQSQTAILKAKTEADAKNPAANDGASTDDEGTDKPANDLARKGNPDALRAWFEDGADGQINWGEAGDHQQCVDVASKYMSEDDAHGFCQLREIAATGESTAEHAHKEKVSRSHEAVLELTRWQRHVKRHGVNGRKKPFVCRAVEPDLAEAIQLMLNEEPDTKVVFEQAKELVRAGV